MAARDDSVIRGSLITSLILLVLSLALNFLLWSWGDTAAEQEAKKDEQLTDYKNSVRTYEEQTDAYKAMLGFGQLSQDQYESYKELNTEDDAFDDVAQQFYRDMQVFGAETGVEDRNYHKLPEYFMDAIRSRNEYATRAVEEAAQVRKQAESDVDTARTAQQKAEEERDRLAKDLDDERVQFGQYRNDMLQKMESAKDSKTKSERRLQEIQRKAGNERNQLVAQAQLLQSTIDTQVLELNRLRNDRFESVQGEVRYVIRGGRNGTQLVSINLGSADALRPGITFGVIDKDETTRLQDASVKASIQVTAIRGPHLAEARVVRVPEIGNPIIEGDAVYSPFWAPGRTVKIALAGQIDIDGDGKPDNSLLEGMIAASGAEVVARVTTAGKEGDLSPSVRFMVVGEPPELKGGVTEEQDAEEVRIIGEAKRLATELGVTVIPAWKLQAYLRTLDDSMTTPLASNARGEDFPPTTAGGPSRRRPVDLSELYTRQRDNVQTNNEIVRP